jgi:hypothetical protein
MPVVLRIGPYRFYFGLRYSAGYNRAESRKIERLVVEHRGVLLEKWHEFFGRR